MCASLDVLRTRHCAFRLKSCLTGQHEVFTAVVSMVRRNGAENNVGLGFARERTIFVVIVLTDGKNETPDVSSSENKAPPPRGIGLLYAVPPL